MKALALSVALLPLLGGCVVTPYLLDAATAPLAAEPDPDDPHFARLCERYGGVVREFEPDPAAGVRLHRLIDEHTDQAGCSLECVAYLANGYAFVEVVGYRNQARIMGRTQVEIYEVGPHAWRRDPVPAQGRTAAFEAVILPKPRSRLRTGGDLDADFTHGGIRILEARGARHGQTRGTFAGFRRLEDGALSGEGRFSLFSRGSTVQGGGRRVATCPG